MNEYATYTCDGCGRSGTVDDGITGYGGPCPDEGCTGRTYPDDPKQDETSYRMLLAGLRDKIEWALPHADVVPRLTDDEMHVALDAISYLNLSLPTDKAPAGTNGVATPWEEYQ